MRHPDLALQLWIKLTNHKPKKILLNLPVSNHKFVPNVEESSYSEVQMIEITNTTIQDKEPEVYKKSVSEKCIRKVHQENVPERCDSLVDYYSTNDSPELTVEQPATANTPNFSTDLTHNWHQHHCNNRLAKLLKRKSVLSLTATSNNVDTLQIQGDICLIDSKPILCIELDYKHNRENTEHDRQNLTTPDSRNPEVDSLKNTLEILQNQRRQADQLEDTNRITHSQRGIQVYNPELNRITGGQEIWTTELGTTLFHLDKEIPEVYSGSEALTYCMLNKLQVQNLQNETDRKQTLIYTNMDWLEGQELNTTKSIWATESGATILPLGNERPKVYSGSEALPDHLLERLQAQNLQCRVGTHHLMPSEPEMLSNLTLDHSNLSYSRNQSWRTNLNNLIYVTTCERRLTAPLDTHDVPQETLCQKGSKSPGLISYKTEMTGVAPDKNKMNQDNILRAATPRERNYATWEGECAALVYNSLSGSKQLGSNLKPSCTGILMNPGGVQQLEVQILIDYGNSLDHCGAITQQCADKLGLTLQPLDLEINTADKNHTMRPGGQVEDLHIWFPGEGEATLLKSVLVLPDLDGNVNLGYKFLQKNRSNLPF